MNRAVTTRICCISLLVLAAPTNGREQVPENLRRALELLPKETSLSFPIESIPADRVPARISSWATDEEIGAWRTVEGVRERLRAESSAANPSTLLFPSRLLSQSRPHSPGEDGGTALVSRASSVRITCNYGLRPSMNKSLQNQIVEALESDRSDLALAILLSVPFDSTPGDGSISSPLTETERGIFTLLRALSRQVDSDWELLAIGSTVEEYAERQSLRRILAHKGRARWAQRFFEMSRNAGARGKTPERMAVLGQFITPAPRLFLSEILSRRSPGEPVPGILVRWSERPEGPSLERTLSATQERAILEWIADAVGSDQSLAQNEAAIRILGPLARQETLPALRRALELPFNSTRALASAALEVLGEPRPPEIPCRFVSFPFVAVDGRPLTGTVDYEIIYGNHKLASTSPLDERGILRLDADSFEDPVDPPVEIRFSIRDGSQEWSLAIVNGQIEGLLPLIAKE